MSYFSLDLDGTADDLNDRILTRAQYYDYLDELAVRRGGLPYGYSDVFEYARDVARETAEASAELERFDHERLNQLRDSLGTAIDSLIAPATGERVALPDTDPHELEREFELEFAAWGID